MLSRLFGIVLTVCLYGAISLGKSRAADDLGTLLTILEARAHSVSTVTWRFQSVSLKGKPFIDLLNEQGGNTNEPQGKSMDPMSIAHKRGIESLSQVVTSKTEGNVLMDLKNMKYKIGPFANEKVISFDGKLYSTIVSPELATPQNSGGRVATLPKYAEFSKTDDSASLTKNLLSVSGYDSMFSRLPLISGTLGMPKFDTSILDFVLAVRKDTSLVKFAVRSKNEWLISLPVLRNNVENGRAEYVFDPQLDGCIVSASWIQVTGFSSSEDYLIENTHWSGKHYGPSKITFIDWMNGVGRKTIISGVSFEPQVNANSFSIETPVGTNIRDHVHKMAYRVSKGPIDEARAMAEYAGTNKLTASKTLERPLMSWKSILGLLGLICLLTIVVFFLKRRKTALLLVILGLLALPSGCSQNKTDSKVHEEVPAIVTNNAFVWDDGWKLSFDGKMQASISQCGLDATMLTLNIMNKVFDPLVVSRALPPTNYGIRLSDVKKVLESHGIDVAARKNCSLRSIQNTLDSRTVAILHVPNGPKSNMKDAHYVVLSCNDKGRLLFLDPPRAPIDLSRTDKLQIDNLTNVTALFCLPTSKAIAHLVPSKSVFSFSSGDFVSGEFCGTISLRNPGNIPISVCSVDRPCSCLAINFEGTIVPASGTVEYRFSVDERQWGSGVQTKTLVFRTHDGRPLCTVSFSGDSGTPKTSTVGHHWIEKIHDIPLNCGIAPLNIEVETLLGQAVNSMREFHIVNSNDWCQATIGNKGGDLSLATACNISDELLSRVSSGRPLQTIIQIFEKADAIPVYTISVFFRRDLEMIHSTTTIGAADGSIGIGLKLSVDIPNVQDWAEWNMSELEVDSTELELRNISRSSETTWDIQLKAQKPLERPYVGVACFTHAQFPAVRKTFLINGRQASN